MPSQMQGCSVLPYADIKFTCRPTSLTGGNFFVLLIIIIGIVGSLMPRESFSKDYFITFVQEQYKEEHTEGKEQIYHTWFVRSDSGNKLLVLTGEDNARRNWLKAYKDKYDLFLISVPDAATGEFEMNTVFNIDLESVHPVDRSIIEEENKKTGAKKKK